MAFSTKVNPRGRGLYRGSIGGQDDRKEEGGGGAEEEGGERRVYKGELIVSKTARTAP